MISGSIQLDDTVLMNTIKLGAGKVHFFIYFLYSSFSLRYNNISADGMKAFSEAASKFSTLITLE